jgi:beta-lactamase superfamily II metal-dependent hydrolase
MADQKNITVRMYNVGFGDSFLLMFPGAERPHRVLVDCGAHSLGPGPVAMKDMVRQIVSDVTDADGKSRIDVVVCTHRHRDHVSGFQNSLWKRVEVGEVWMPWTEHPTDEVARRIRESQSRRAQSLTLALTRLGADDSTMSIAENSLTNAQAMRTLHGGFLNVRRRRFLPTEKESKRSFTTSLLPNVEIHVMGPSRDENVIRDMEPEKGESYLQFLLSRTVGTSGRVRPFREEWIVKPGRYRRNFGHLEVTKAQQRSVENIGSGSDFDLVTKLEKAVNGTSLMLMFVCGRAHLLFAGDAQWGTWSAALNDTEWSEMLSKTTFYKVGHHASHNATPRAFVEKHLSKKFLAMVSTRPVKKWPEIPRGPLLSALRERSNRVVRSDKPDVPDAQGFERKPLYVETTVPI